MFERTQHAIFMPHFHQSCLTYLQSSAELLLISVIRAWGGKPQVIVVVDILDIDCNINILVYITFFNDC